MWPAVPVLGNSVPIEGAFSTISEHDHHEHDHDGTIAPSAYYNSPVSEDSVYDLFDNHSSPEPTFGFFEEGLASASVDDHTPTFDFDSMVDLNADQSAPIFPADDFTNLIETFPTESNDLFDTVTSEPSSSAPAIVTTDLPHQSAATASVLQPLIGASS